MIKKNYLIILLFLIIAIGAISQASAADANATDEIASDDASIEEVACEEITEDDLASPDAADEEIIAQDSTAEIVGDDEQANNDTQVTPKATLSQSGTTAKDKKITVKTVDENSGNVLKNTKVSLSFSNSKGSVVKKLTLTTNDNGVASSKISLKPGIYTVKATMQNSSKTATLKNFKITKPVKISAGKFTAVFKTNKKFKVKVLDSNKKAVSGIKVKIKVYTGSKYKVYTVKTNSKGIASVKTSAMKVGKHKVIVSISDKLYPAKSVKTTIKIKPRPVSIKTVSGKTKYLAFIGAVIKDKTSKKYVDGITVKLLIYTGSKHKTVKLVTGYDKEEKVHGEVIYLTNVLSVGTHKVKIVVDGTYKGTKTSKIVIPKSAKSSYPVYGYFSKGKTKSFVKYGGQWYRAN